MTTSNPSGDAKDGRRFSFRNATRTVRNVVIATILTFCLLELALRLVGHVMGEPARSFLQESARIPYSNLRIYGGLKGGIQILIPPAHKADILVVGDSFPFGTYEKSEDVFPSVLARSSGRSVVNVGVGSTGPVEYNRMLEIGLRYEPSVVLYCIFANDFVYDEDRIRPLSDKNTNISLPGDEVIFRSSLEARDRRANIFKAITNQSISYQMMKLFQQPLAKHQTISWVSQGNFFMFASAEYWDPQISSKDPVVQRRTGVNLRLIENANAFAKEHNQRLIVVLQPSKEMVYGPLATDLPIRIYDESHSATYQILAQQLERQGIPTIDLTAALRAEAKKGVKLYHSIDGHFNEAGHRLVADQLVAYLSKTMNETVK
jgi:hypothetical protein